MSNLNKSIRNEQQEIDFANSKIKEIEEFEQFQKKQLKVASKILAELQTVSDDMGKLFELQQTRMSKLEKNEKEDHMVSLNFMKDMQNNFIQLKDELSKGYAYQNELLSSEIAEVKGVITKNTKKPIDTIETMSIMTYQLNKLFKMRNKIIQRHQFQAFRNFNSSMNVFADKNPQVTAAMKQIEDLQNDIQNTPLRGVLYCGKSVSEILQQEQRSEKELPLVVEHIINIIQSLYIDHEGIFRTAGNQKEIQDVSTRLSVTDLTHMNIDNLTGLLKKIIRDIPGNLFNGSHARDMLTEYLKSTYRNERIKHFKALFERPNWVSPADLTIFKGIMSLCHKIAQRQDLNKMSEKNLSVCWTPSIFAVGTEEIGNYLDMVAFIILECDFIFEDKSVQSAPSQRVGFGALKSQKVRTTQQFDFMSGNMNSSNDTPPVQPQSATSAPSYAKASSSDPSRYTKGFRSQVKTMPGKPTRSFFQQANRGDQHQSTTPDSTNE